MRIDKNELIAGQPILRMRDYLRRFGHRYIEQSAVADWFGVSPRMAEQIVRELHRRGWIELANGGTDNRRIYETTIAGNALAGASALPPMSRERAGRLLADFLKRVEEVNNRDELTHRVTKVYVFGSYLNKKAANIGDLDLAVILTNRNVAGRDFSKYRLKRADESGKRFNTYFQRLFYGEREVRRLLKGRNPYISIHPLSDIEEINAKSKLIYNADAKSK